MQPNHFFYYLALFVMLFTACKDSDSDGDQNKNSGDELKVTKEIFSGYAQKGPFINGSSVTVSELKPNLDQTGRTYSTTIASNSGNFEQRNIELNSHYAELKVDGYYFNEVSGITSISQMTLYALVDVKNTNSANVNVLTHLEKPRVEYLVKQKGMSFSEAKQQAQRDVLAIFGFEPPESASEALNLTDDAALLAISCILQGYLSTGDMMALMANISADIKTDGILDNTALGSKLINNAYAVSLSIANVRNNLTAKYADLGIDVTIPDFESYIQSFLDSGLYPKTLFITYPSTGLYGDNILSETVSSVKINSNYSMKADVPEGLSLKIVLKDGIWAFGALSPVNWSITLYDHTNQRQEFTVTESGKSNDLNFYTVMSYITIEYYENGSTTPTKVKTLYVEE